MLSSVQTIFPSYQFWDRNHSPESPKYVFRDPGLHCLKGGFGILKKSGGEIRDWKHARDVVSQK